MPATIKITIQVVTIILAVVSNLASVGSKISIEKDWVLVIANNDKERLTKINSIFRTIDLVGAGLLDVQAFIAHLNAFNLVRTNYLMAKCSVTDIQQAISGSHWNPTFVFLLGQRMLSQCFKNKRPF